MAEDSLFIFGYKCNALTLFLRTFPDWDVFTKCPFEFIAVFKRIEKGNYSDFPERVHFELTGFLSTWRTDFMNRPVNQSVKQSVKDIGMVQIWTSCPYAVNLQSKTTIQLGRQNQRKKAFQKKGIEHRNVWFFYLFFIFYFIISFFIQDDMQCVLLCPNMQSIW